MNSIENPTGAPKSPEAAKQERFEKGEAAFSESYETALMLRDFDRGWGKFEDSKGMPVRLRLSKLSERAANIATAALSQSQPIAETLKKELLEEAIALQAELLVFTRTENVSKFPVNTQELKDSLEKNDPIKVLKTAVSMGAMISVIDYTNELLLRPADKATESHNSLNK